MSQSDVSSTRLAASGAAWDQRTRLKGVYLVGTAVAGTATFKDGGSGGTTRLVLDTPAQTAVVPVFVQLPADGLLFSNDMYVTFSGGLGAVTAFFG